jgi:hypothetical protein
VVVAMMEIRHVRVSVDDFAMSVSVAVARCRLGVSMVVVGVIVDVFVLVLDRLVTMLMEMG